MAKSANLHIRIDPETKNEAEKLFSSFGISITDAVNMFLRQSIIVGGLPFALRQLKPNATTAAAMQKIDDVINGKMVSKPQSVVSFFKEMGENVDS